MFFPLAAFTFERQELVKHVVRVLLSLNKAICQALTSQTGALCNVSKLFQIWIVVKLKNQKNA